MLIEFSNLSKYGITPRGVIHVGMHKAEEYAIYKTANVQKICFIEANPKIAPVKENTKTPANISKSIEEPTHLMTETLAKVYLEQKNIQKPYKLMKY